MTSLAMLPEFLIDENGAIEDGGYTDRQKPLTIWVPNDYKEKYGDLQKKSGRKFSKHLQAVVKLAIDKVSK